MQQLNNFIALLQIETVGPEGEKLKWVFLVIVIGVGLFLLIKKKNIIKIPNFTRKVKAEIKKNKIINPTVIHLNIRNNSKKAIVIEHPVLRFKRLRGTKAYKIKSVGNSNIYPLFLEANKTHELPVSLLPFYEFDKNLKKYSRIRIEFKYNDNRAIKTSYLLLKSTLFRKAFK